MDRKHAGARSELLATAWLLGQGYEVFRNVSQHGLVDIVGIKDGETILFDVKSVAFSISGDRAQARLTAAQIERAVKVINVYADGACEIDLEPQAKGENGYRACVECNTKFKLTSKRQRFCRSKCRSDDWLRQQREKLGMRAVA